MALYGQPQTSFQFEVAELRLGHRILGHFSYFEGHNLFEQGDEVFLLHILCGGLFDAVGYVEGFSLPRKFGGWNFEVFEPLNSLLSEQGEVVLRRVVDSVVFHYLDAGGEMHFLCGALHETLRRYYHFISCLSVRILEPLLEFDFHIVSFNYYKCTTNLWQTQEYGASRAAPKTYAAIGTNWFTMSYRSFLRYLLLAVS